jgi:hypothetical protein
MIHLAGTLRYAGTLQAAALCPLISSAEDGRADLRLTKHSRRLIYYHRDELAVTDRRLRGQKLKMLTTKLRNPHFQDLQGLSAQHFYPSG